MTEIRDDVDQQEEFRPIGDATYCPEDNKLRFYPDGRFSDEVKNRFKSAGFKWASKQGIYVAPAWTPDREDLLIELCGEIGDEDYSPEERSADRAERFSGYRDKRRSEAGGYADRFESGPSAFGHQNQRRAERQANRHDRLRTRSLTQWDKAEYWQHRTAGVISHALHKSSAPVRRERILRLEAEQRKHLKNLADLLKYRKGWEVVHDEEDGEKATKIARYVAGNNIYDGQNYQHPRNPEISRSLWSLLTLEDDPISGHEAAALYFENRQSEPGTLGDRWERWSRHYENRLAYENAMLENEGGKASEVEMIPGGFFQGAQIQKINRSSVTKRVVSIQFVGGKRPINIERLGEGHYREPTAEELEAFNAAKKAAPKGPSLINPTMEDAQRLQRILNQKAAESYASRTYNNGQAAPTAQQVEAMTQAEWSRWSKYDTYSTCEYMECCKIRRHHRYLSTSADSIIVITDKPQKPLPINWEKFEQPAQGTNKENTTKAEQPQKSLKRQFEEWVTQQHEIHGELTDSHHVNNDETGEEYILFQFSDGTRGCYEAHGIGYGTPTEPAQAEEKFQLSN